MSELQRQTGLFAGLFSSTNGTWIPMGQLRRMSSTAAWMLFYGFVAYGAIDAKDLANWALLGIIVLGPVSYAVFLLLGGLVYCPGERKEHCGKVTP